MFIRKLSDKVITPPSYRLRFPMEVAPRLGNKSLPGFIHFIPEKTGNLLRFQLSGGTQKGPDLTLADSDVILGIYEQVILVHAPGE